METMSVSRALAEVKRIDSRIQHAIQEGLFVAVTIGKNSTQKLHESTLTIEAAKSKIQESFDKLNSMFNTREKLKAALVKSNATTFVTVMNKQITVAEAIEMKTSIASRKSLLVVLKQQLQMATRAVGALNNKLDEFIELNLKTVYGSDKFKSDPAAYESVAKPQREVKEAALLDPKNISKKIEEYTEEISLVETELDYILSTSNATTIITF